MWVCAAAIALVSCCATPASAQCELDKLLPPNRDASEDVQFAYSVAIDGSYLLVGMPGADVIAAGAGAAGLFGLTNGEARLVLSLYADDGGVGDEFGWAVAIDGDLIVVGAPDAHHRGVETGAVYVFHRDEGGPDAWGQTAKLVASNAAESDRFGSAVSICGDTIVVGACDAEPPGGDSPSGTAHVFQHRPGDPSSWLEIASLNGTDANQVDNDFGDAVDIDGDTVIVGDWREQVGLDVQAGSAYIFERHHGGQDNWGEVKKITADPSVHTGQLGSSVSIHGNTVTLGSPGDDNIFYQASGSAYIFERDHGGEDNWGELQKLTASDMSVGDVFGRSVAIHGDRAIVGASGNSDDGLESGSAYIFKRSGADVWSEVEKLTASDAAADDWFGFSVDLDADRALIGAVVDDEDFKDSGSAYVFDVGLGDIDGDCIVGPHDLILMLGAWGDCPAPENCHNCHLDLDGDCTIGTSDLIILLGNWG